MSILQVRRWPGKLRESQSAVEQALERIACSVVMPETLLDSSFPLPRVVFNGRRKLTNRIVARIENRFLPPRKRYGSYSTLTDSRYTPGRKETLGAKGIANMGWIATTITALTCFGQGAGPTTVAPTPTVGIAPGIVSAESAPSIVDCGETATPCGDLCTPGKAFAGDRAFDGFIGPISSPVYSKDPRSLTEIRGLYVHNWLPGDGFFQGGHFDALAAQIRVALTERLTLIADKDGYLFLKPGNVGLGNRDGFMNVAAGLKYTFLRDVETQTIAAAGFMYEAPTGERNVFQNGGNGIVTPFVTFGKEFSNCVHILGNVAHSTALSPNSNSGFLFTQLHVDKGVDGWLYPLFEVNWYHYTRGGNALPLAVGEGDGLLSLGTQGIAGKNLVTIAPGLKAKLSRNLETGFVYERAITGRKDLIEHRFIGELIVRF